MNYQELAIEATKASPPVTVSSMIVAGVPLSDWVFIATLGWIALQAFFLLRDKWWRQRGSKN